jgi:hypothetical protein
VTLSEAKKLELPEVAKDRATYDFLQAVQLVDPTWASSNEVYISKTKTTPDILDLIAEFRDHVRLYPSQSTDWHSAFATLQGLH